jgi:hypothetical protein
VVAYRIGNSLPPPSPQLSMTELKFLSLQYDKRADITVVFRIVRKEPRGDITVIWRELERKNSPKITFARNEDLIDFKRR